MTPMLSRSALASGFGLAALMASTRSHHFGTVLHLPDASWAVFFLAGFYLRPWWVFPALLALAGTSDYVAIKAFSVSDFCISRAYGFLLPAYGALWLAGRWYAGRYRFALSTLVPLVASVLAGATLCELFSSGGFYFFSGRFDPSLTEFGSRLARYFPLSLAAMAFYVLLATIVHVALAAIPLSASNNPQTQGLKAR
ncbi:MAG: hypothetical protein ACREYE_03875 [Gammaproteobacteria bacterium]